MKALTPHEVVNQSVSPQDEGRMSISWTEDRVTQLKSLCAEGYSYSQIARMIGGISRNAAIGKALRLGITNLEPQGARRQKPTRDRTFKAHKLPPLPPRPPVIVAEPLRIPLLAAGPSACRWPLWGMDDPTGRFEVCGHKCEPEQSYCAEHRAIVFQPMSSTRARNKQAEKTVETAVAA